jgi:streptogramin lyase
MRRSLLALPIPALLLGGAYLACTPFAGQSSTPALDAGAGEVAIATGEIGPTAIAVDSTGIYWVNDKGGTIKRADPT